MRFRPAHVIRRVGRKGWLIVGLVVGTIAAPITYVALNLGSTALVPWANLLTLDAHSLNFVGGDPMHVLFGYHQGVLESRDGGRTWMDLSTRSDAMEMQPASDGSLVIAGHDIFEASTDGGASWHAIENDLPNIDIHIHGFARDPAVPTHMWAYLPTGGVYESLDTGRHWQRVYADDILYLGAVVSGGATHLLGVDLDGLTQSTDGGRTWHAIGAPPTYPVLSLTASADGQMVFIGSLAGLVRSDDGGRTWANTGFTKQPFAIAIANGGRTVAVVTRFGSYYRSDDGARSWPGP